MGSKHVSASELNETIGLWLEPDLITGVEIDQLKGTWRQDLKPLRQLL